MTIQEVLERFPPETSYYHVGVSGGKDSTATALWAKYESGIPSERLVLSFCDTGNEHQWTYEHVALINEQVHPVWGISPERDFYELADHKNRFPGAKSRFCTEHLKMIPTQAFVNFLASDGSDVVMMTGVRAGESADRAALPDFEEAWLSYFGYPTYRPLLRYTIADVWEMHKRYDIPPNPLYATGCKRVGCLPCIMSRKKEVANIAIRFPERIERIRDAENTSRRHTGFSSFFPRRHVPLKWRDKIVAVDAPTTNLTKKQEKGLEGVFGLEAFGLDRGVRPAAIENAERVLMAVTTIDGVVKWALNEPDLYAEEFDFYDTEEEVPPACDSRYGACE